MQYKLELNLQQIAALRIAIWFWKKKVIKDKSVEFFKSSNKLHIYEAEQKWGELTKTLVDEWNRNVLPKQIDAELIYIVKTIGKAIFDWHQYIKYQYKVKENEAINCIDKIHWTPYGTVDTVETFELYWLNNRNLDITKVYHFACNHALEDHIDELWNKIPSDIQDHYEDSIYERYRLNQHSLAYWDCCRNNESPYLVGYFHSFEYDFDTEDMEAFNLIYEPHLSTEEKMLRLSVHQGYYAAAKYFWEKLTEKEQGSNISKCIEIVVSRYHYYKEEMKHIKYKISQYAEICIFLMNQMTEDQKKIFFNKSLEFNVIGNYSRKVLDVKDAILHMLLSTWPWEELFMPILEDMIKYQDDDSVMNGAFLEAITAKMVEGYEFGYSLETHKYRCLFYEVWLKTSKFITKKIEFERLFSYLVTDFIRVWDLDNLKLILNNPEIAACRDKFIDFGSSSYSVLIMEDHFEKLDQFVEEICRSDEEKKQFKQRIDVPEGLIYKGQVDLIDKFLDWKGSTPEERQSLKNDTDHITICASFIVKKIYNLVDKFLDWKFDTEEEKINCKVFYKHPGFSIGQICEIWKNCNKDIIRVKNECSEFLHWLFQSEEEIVLFKKEMLVNFEDGGLSTDDLLSLRRDGMMDIFISWCMLDDERFLQFYQIKETVPQLN